MRITPRLLFSSLCIAGTLLAIACSSTTVTTPTATPGDAGATDPDAAPAEDSATPEPPAPFKLTSAALEEGATFPKDNTCNGTEKSPDFAWGPGPEGTLSYAIVFNDETLGFLHGVTYDIPATVNALPAALENTYEPAKAPGVKQSLSYKPNRYGYAGPCPPSGEDTYEFVLYALKVDTLANVTKTSTRAAVEIEVKKQMLKSTKLTGKYQQP